MIYIFGDFELDTTNYELRASGASIPIEPKAFDVLAYLLAHHDQTVMKEELLEQVWPNLSVSDSTLSSSISSVRRAIGDRDHKNRLIQTVYRRGYRFVATVTRYDDRATRHRRLPIDTRDHMDALIVPQSDESLARPPTTSLDQALSPANPDDKEALFRERYYVTVMACRLRVTGALEGFDPEELHRIMRRAHLRCAEIIKQGEGYIAQYHSDGLVVYFGYPRTREDDAIRAVRTGLHLVQAVAELHTDLGLEADRSLSIRVGLQSSDVILADVGDGEHSDRLAMGNAPTFADELLSLADPGMVLIGSITARLIGPYFHYQEMALSPSEVKSSLHPVYHLLYEHAGPTKLEGAGHSRLPPFSGRSHEFGLLIEHARQVEEGVGKVILISGEPGIGKSRLADALREHLASTHFTEVLYRCFPHSQHSAFRPVIDSLQVSLNWQREDTDATKLNQLEIALTRLGVELGNTLPALAELLSLPLSEPIPSPALDARQKKRHTLDALVAWVLKLSEQAPVLLVMEDLHWADPSTLEYLSLLVNQAPTARLFILLTCRPNFTLPWERRSDLIPLTLTRLSRVFAEAMITGIVGYKPLPQELVQQILQRAEGVPLFIEELTHMVLESELVTELQQCYELAAPLQIQSLPSNLQGVLMSRLDQLGSAKHIAQLSFILGREFPYELLRAVTPMDEQDLQAALEQLVKAEFLFQFDLPAYRSYRFKHNLIQEAAYQSLLHETRLHYHKLIAQAVSQQAPKIAATQPELVAHHLTQAGHHAESLSYWLTAAQQASSRSANLEAISHATKGIELLHTCPDSATHRQLEFDFQTILADALTITKGVGAPEVEYAYARARALSLQVGETPRLFPVLWGLWMFYNSKALFADARGVAQQYMNLAQAIEEPCFISDAHYMLGATAFYQAELIEARDQLEAGARQALPERRQAPFSRRGYTPQIMGLTRIALVRCWQGFASQSLRLSQEALDLAVDLATPFGLALAKASMALICFQHRDMVSVQTLSESVISLAQTHDFPHWLAQGAILLGCARIEQGRLSEGLGLIRQGVADYQSVGIRVGVAAYQVKLAHAYGRNHQIDAGLDALAEAREMIEAYHDRFYEPEAHRIEGELLYAQSADHEMAEVALRCAMNIAHASGAKLFELRAALSLCHLWQQRRRHTEAQTLLASVYEGFTEGFDTGDLQEATRLLRLLKD